MKMVHYSGYAADQFNCSDDTCTPPSATCQVGLTVRSVLTVTMSTMTKNSFTTWPASPWRREKSVNEKTVDNHHLEP